MKTCIPGWASEFVWRVQIGVYRACKSDNNERLRLAQAPQEHGDDPREFDRWRHYCGEADALKSLNLRVIYDDSSALQSAAQLLPHVAGMHIPIGAGGRRAFHEVCDDCRPPFGPLPVTRSCSGAPCVRATTKPDVLRQSTPAAAPPSIDVYTLHATHNPSALPLSRRRIPR